MYFPAPILREILLGLAAASIDPHLHTDGDRAVREALDAVAAMRRALPGRDVRPALAHCELDRQTGSLEMGKLADLFVLDRNVLKIPAEDIAKTRVLRTVVGGKVIYDTGELGDAVEYRSGTTRPQ